jgi:hypothetical protein
VETGLPRWCRPLIRDEETMSKITARPNNNTTQVMVHTVAIISVPYGIKYVYAYCPANWVRTRVRWSIGMEFCSRRYQWQRSGFLLRCSSSILNFTVASICKIQATIGNN